jgi:hypothetical protein
LENGTSFDPEEDFLPGAIGRLLAAGLGDGFSFFASSSSESSSSREADADAEAAAMSFKTSRALPTETPVFKNPCSPSSFASTIKPMTKHAGVTSVKLGFSFASNCASMTDLIARSVNRSNTAEIVLLLLSLLRFVIVLLFTTTRPTPRPPLLLFDTFEDNEEGKIFF